MTEPRIVSPEESQRRFAASNYVVQHGVWDGESRPSVEQERQTLLRLHAELRNLARTVATEPDRTRAAVVEALRDAATLAVSTDAILVEHCGPSADWSEAVEAVADSIRRRADKIESGADW